MQDVTTLSSKAEPQSLRLEDDQSPGERPRRNDRTERRAGRLKFQA